MTALRTLLLGCLLGGVFMPPAAGAEPAGLSADIGPRPLTEALTAFGRQTGLQLIYVSSVAETLQSKGAPAGLTAPAALTQLLDGTGLTFEFLNARTVRIFPAPTVVPTVTASTPVPSRLSERHAASRGLGLEEVIVSATQGKEPLSRVPIDMVAWTEEAMEVSSVKGIAQLASLTPGVDFGFAPGIDVYTDLVIRGVTNLHGTAVGVYLDDSPIPPARAATYLRSYPMTFDLERVEILRGPQTVLLGDHSLGGAVRFIPNQPSITTSTGLFRAEWGTTQYGGPSYEVGAAVGGPLMTDVLGFRVSGWLREEGGYVDRVDPFTCGTVDACVTVDPNSNRYLNKVVRGALTFAPTVGVQVTPSLTYQSIRIRDTSAFVRTLSHPGCGIFRNATFEPQPVEESYYLASLKFTAGLPAADLSVLASYFDQAGNATVELGSVPPLTKDDVMPEYFHLEQRAYSGEVRLASRDPDGELTWIAGMFYSKEHARHSVSDPSLIGDATVAEKEQLAGFGQIALKITQRLTANAGVRIGHSKYDTATESPPPYNAHDSDSWTAPRFGLSYQADDFNLLYLTVAKGYGSGGVYPPIPDGSPQPYPADALWSYEIGSKHALLGGRLRLDTSIFHIDWNNGPPDLNFAYQEQVPVPGKVVSNGFGLTAEALVAEHTKVTLGVAYTDAHITQTLALDGQPFVRKGDSLPVSPWNVTASIEQVFLLRGNATASVRVEDAFRSTPGRTYADNSNGGAPVDPSINVLNMRSSVTWAGFEVAVLLSNALGTQPTLSGGSNGVTITPPSQAVTLVPRTLSVSGTWRF